MSFEIPTRQTLARYAGVALLACGNIAGVYGAWQFRGLLNGLSMPELVKALPVFVVFFSLPLAAICALFEVPKFKLSRLVGLPVKAGDSPWLSALAFGTLGAFWVLLKGGWADREAAKAEAALAKPQSNEPSHKPSPGREAIETVVFVVVLVLMLKLFVVEAFVIPTGSMAETLYGYQKIVTCPECGFEFPVNASREVEPSGGGPAQQTAGYCCPNCRYENTTGAKGLTPPSGDRVLVGKFLSVDDRGHVVVFKFPDEPQTKQVAQNYIKRLVGLPGETIAVYNGDLYVTTALKYPADAADETGRPLYPRPSDPNDYWRAPFITTEPTVSMTDRGAITYGESIRVRWDGPDYRYTNATVATELFAESRKAGFALGREGFQVVRKPDDLVTAMRRIVYDNDHQSKNLIQAGAKPRWDLTPDAGTGWKADNAAAPKLFAHTGGDLGWVRYQHLVPKGFGWAGIARPDELIAQPITNFMGYNAGFEGEPPRQGNLSNSNHWVGDLILECEAKVADGGAVVLELAKGDHRYRAEFDGGQVRLKMFPDQDGERVGEDGVKRDGGVRVVPVGDDAFTRATRPSGLKAGTTHRLRFANVDCRLRVWVDDQPIDFGDKADYPPPFAAAKEGVSEPWTRADVERPASIGASGTAAVSGLKLWRDTFYVNHVNDLTKTTELTYYVQPGHYLCMGDNSSQSSDGRMWGLVPDRLMLGRAVFTFFPIDRIGFIR